MLKSKRKVAIVVDSFTMHGRELLSGIGDYVQENNQWQTRYVEYSLQSEPPAWLASWKGDGIIVRDAQGHCCEAALATGAAVVDLSVRRRCGTPTVVSDHPMSVRLALKHLRERGYKHLGFVGVSGTSFSAERKQAFLEQTGETRHVFELDSGNMTIYPWKMVPGKLEKWLANLPKPIGLFTAFDPIGVYVLEACAARKIPVPDAVGVLGCNNDEVQCKLAKPSLSSVIINSHSIGYHACLLLDELMEGKPAPQPPTVVPVLGVAARQSTDALFLADSLVVRALRFIRENAILGIDIEQVARHCGVSSRTLERRFQQATGTSPVQELTQVRIRHAEELLRHSNLIIDAVASRSGFDSVSHFSMVFKKKTGLSPGEFRKQFG
ncbi:MAG: DNA-binding transcriptional regulator [Planctomycetia bacterium]|nr:DNA-binding transcriptional regulator [Planctomycetia bacterium]